MAGQLRGFYHVMFALQGNKCAYCRRVLQNRSANRNDADGWTRDHVRPRSLGNEDLENNVVLACFPCNHKKSTNPPAPCYIEIAAELWRQTTKLHAIWIKRVLQIPKKKRAAELAALIEQADG
jgi:5-methylcytosine-specific restriction endonuclease McrA